MQAYKTVGDDLQKTHIMVVIQSETKRVCDAWFRRQFEIFSYLSNPWSYVFNFPRITVVCISFFCSMYFIFYNSQLRIFFLSLINSLINELMNELINSLFND